MDQRDEFFIGGEFNQWPLQEPTRNKPNKRGKLRPMPYQQPCGRVQNPVYNAMYNPYMQRGMYNGGLNPGLPNPVSMCPNPMYQQNHYQPPAYGNFSGNSKPGPNIQNRCLSVIKREPIKFEPQVPKPSTTTEPMPSSSNNPPLVDNIKCEVDDNFKTELSDYEEGMMDNGYDAMDDIEAINKRELKRQKKAEKKKKQQINMKLKGPWPLHIKKLNLSLSKNLMPIDSLTLLNDLKPTCVYEVREMTMNNELFYVTEVKCNGRVLGAGQAKTKPHSKVLAAEKTIQMILSNSLKLKYGMHAGLVPWLAENTSDLPWQRIACYALFKLYTQWQKEGVDIPLKNPLAQRHMKVSKKKLARELPPNASQINPVALLNKMKKGLVPKELDRVMGPTPRVTMAYRLNGKVFTGVGRTVTEATEKAARAVLVDFWGLKP